jgi:hypothetical protein
MYMVSSGIWDTTFSFALAVSLTIPPADLARRVTIPSTLGVTVICNKKVKGRQSSGSYLPAVYHVFGAVEQDYLSFKDALDRVYFIGLLFLIFSLLF